MSLLSGAQSQNRSDIFTVSKLNRFAKHILESEIGSIWISAEISNFVAASSGHWYFTLKDARAQVKAAMFKGANRRVAIRPKEGDKVLVRGDISLYEARGDYQLIASHLELDGEGDLKAQFERLKTRLAAEGLFAQENKQAIPQRPARIGVITSPTGAAVRDIISVLKRRNPGIEVIIYPSIVQGQEAVPTLVKALQTANQDNQVDAIIIGRGGGSMEDLWCFNDETLARTLAQSHIPIVSAVGHEVDFTICDFVADLRAATPTAAAELLSYSNDESLKQIQSLKHRLHGLMRHQIQVQKQALTTKQQQLQALHPQLQIQQQWQKLDSLHFRLNELTTRRLNQAALRFRSAKFRIEKLSPQTALQRGNLQLDSLNKRLQKAMTQKLADSRQRLSNSCHLLDTVSPLATLSRGYSITYKEDEILKAKDQVEAGDVITTRLQDGEVQSRVE